MNPEWSDIQKVAFIDNTIGKKISYTPEFGTEACIKWSEKPRALWKIISSGYGVCNGIAQVEQYMLSKVGINAEQVSGEQHAFLKLKNIELPTANGEMVKGNTILDPTWNLGAHRYGYKPETFCKSYLQIRRGDILSNGKDTESHANDEELADATLNLDEKSLRQIFASIGLADKDGVFPIQDIIKSSKVIDNSGYSEEENIKKQFSLLAEYYPEFATCNNETAGVLKKVFLANENLRFNKCVVNRVYDRKDKNRKAVLYVYTDLHKVGKKFYYADKGSGQFIELSQEKFEEKFECYDYDLYDLKEVRPWENSEKQEKSKGVTR